MAGDDLVLGRSRIVQSSTGKSVAVGASSTASHTSSRMCATSSWRTRPRGRRQRCHGIRRHRSCRRSRAAGATPMQRPGLRSFVAEISPARRSGSCVKSCRATERRSSPVTQRRSTFAAHRDLTKLSVVFDFNKYVEGITQQGSAAVSDSSRNGWRRSTPRCRSPTMRVRRPGHSPVRRCAPRCARAKRRRRPRQRRPATGYPRCSRIWSEPAG